MKILAVDIGTGTQDVFLFDARLHMENGFKLVMPSPTMIVRRKVQQATKRGESILLTGVTMGGGPSHWAVEDHLRAGFPVFATPAAARSFNDDLDEVAEMGIQVVSEDEAKGMQGIQTFELKDFDYAALRSAFDSFGVSLSDLALVIGGVFDHGAAPPKYSDRKFRFEYINERVRAQNRLSAFAYKSADVPDRMTRLQAVVASAQNVDAPLMVMDTAPAAILGATLDPKVRRKERIMIANIGNFHTLAFRLGPTGIEGVFEHHTGFMNEEKFQSLLIDFADGTLTNEFVFNDQGHGAMLASNEPFDLGDAGSVAIIGPRRNMMVHSPLSPYFPAPYGDMMLVGCFGMIRAAADIYPEFKAPILETLQNEVGREVAPWDI